MSGKIPGWVDMPEWVKWIAVDEDGRCFGYRHKPKLKERYKEWVCSKLWMEINQVKYLYSGPRPKDYTQELYEVIWTYE